VKLLDLLAPERIVVPLEAATLEEAGDRLADALASSGAARDPAQVRDLVRAQLPRGVVTVGEAFLVHLRTDAVTQLAAALGVAREPIPRGDDSNISARIVIVVAGPRTDPSAYLQALSAFARVLNRRETVEAITAARSRDDVLAAAPLAQAELPGYLTVRDVMVPRTLSVRPDATLGAASRLMVAHNVSALPVVSETNELLGMVSHREVLRYLLPIYVKRISGPAFKPPPPVGEHVGDPHDLPVRNVMDRSVLSVSEDQTLADVATLMVNKNIDRFPVVREGTLVGFLTRGDVVRRIFGP
jgi:CBS domain-containing protein